MALLCLIFGIIALPLGVAAAYFYLQFAASPHKRWRDRVLVLKGQAHAQAARERKNVHDLSTKRERDDCDLREQALTKMLSAVSARELETYPGIGAVTIGKLMAAGFKNLASLRNAHIRVHGLGSAR